MRADLAWLFRRLGQPRGCTSARTAGGVGRRAALAAGRRVSRCAAARR
ncbi:hypothetical protein BUH_5066 [Burkholderia pseudomallei Pakistan 9]|nr:hypothetical protein BUH_5066 [Burkholderia pseudomallei Pakistan 9]